MLLFARTVVLLALASWDLSTKRTVLIGAMRRGDGLFGWDVGAISLVRQWDFGAMLEHYGLRMSGRWPP